MACCGLRSGVGEEDLQLLQEARVQDRRHGRVVPPQGPDHRAGRVCATLIALGTVG